jgi:hypothetical protein
MPVPWMVDRLPDCELVTSTAVAWGRGWRTGTAVRPDAVYALLAEVVRDISRGHPPRTRLYGEHGGDGAPSGGDR